MELGGLIEYEFLNKAVQKLNLFFSFDPPKPPLLKGDKKIYLIKGVLGSEVYKSETLGL